LEAKEMAGLKALANLKVKDVPNFVKSNVTRDAVSQKDMVVVAQLQ
jgi:hypothetical protein